MIKKISQLDDLPLSAYDKTQWVDEDKMLKKLLGTLFEVSYETNVADEVPSYYNSYKCELSAISSMLDLDEIWKVLNAIRNGYLSIVAVDSNLCIGSPGGGEGCLANDHQRYPNNSHRVSCFYPFYEHNDMICHKQMNVHENAEIYGITHCNGKLCCEKEVDVYGNTIFHDRSKTFRVQSQATFEQLIEGTAYRAQWGDLAEIYSADADYGPGTLVKFGGCNEVTIATDSVNAVVTTEPGVVLNSKEEVEHPVGLALVGKVPVKVRGPVKKFDKIVLSKTDPGVGVVYNYGLPFEIIGVALEENSSDETKLVLCATKFNLN